MASIAAVERSFAQLVPLFHLNSSGCRPGLFRGGKLPKIGGRWPSEGLRNHIGRPPPGRVGIMKPIPEVLAGLRRETDAMWYNRKRISACFHVTHVVPA